MHRRRHDHGSTRYGIGDLQVQDAVTTRNAEMPQGLPVHADGAGEINVRADSEPAAFEGRVPLDLRTSIVPADSQQRVPDTQLP